MVRSVLVTGANSGVGLEVALHLAELGFRVIGTARTEEKATSLAKAADDAGVDVEVAVLDVTDADGCERLVGRLQPWGLVNNAAYMNVGQVLDVPAEDALRQFETLVVAPMRLATLAFPAMRHQGEGRIVNVSSVAAHATAAMTGWYQACKHALSAVTDALRREVADYGIDVVLIEPGGLDTGIWDKARDDLLRRRRRSANRTAYDRSLWVLRSARPFMGHPRQAAEVIGQALTAGRPRAHYRVGADAPVIQFLEFVLPDRLKDRMARTALGGPKRPSAG
ncbi:MAG TPA: SDR family NAD(P)-dependent oxidoreductase [Acidimicrobiales bacterium]|nr:SDR family NAD(P)-dependent oxidoreductase [Acidimicrobiales bacterium]